MSRPTSRPALRAISLGAGVQSTTILLLAAMGRISPVDVAIFADTGWETQAVATHLRRLTPVAQAAGIELVTVSSGHIRDDALNPGSRFASMPLFTLGPRGEKGIARRQCTHQYKIKPIRKEVRRRLGYPGRARIPAGVYAQMLIGISLDEIGRARDSDVKFTVHQFPLLDLGWRRGDCRDFLTRHGFGDTPRSSCIGCPFHRDEFWHRLKTGSPQEWADAVAFDHAIRHGSARANAAGQQLRGQFFLHAQRVPLDQVTLRPRDSQPREAGCGPFTCPSSREVA